MSEQNLAFPIPNSVLEPYIKTAVSTMIASALGDGTQIIQTAVIAALGELVDVNGRVSNYKSENKFPIVEIIAKNRIREIAAECIKEMADEMRPQIKEHIGKQIKAKHSDLAKALVDGMVESLQSSWNVQVKFNSDK